MCKRIVLSVLTLLTLSSCGSVPNDSTSEIPTDVSKTSDEYKTSFDTTGTSGTADTTTIPDISISVSSQLRSGTVTNAETTKEESSEEVTHENLSEDELKIIAENSAASYINWFECDDFDGDGLIEAFMIIGDTPNEDGESYGYCSRLMFVNSSGNVSIVKDTLFADLFYFNRTKNLRFGNKSFFSFSVTAGGSGSAAYVFGVEGDTAKEYDISASKCEVPYSEFRIDEDGKTYAVSDAFYFGHQWFDNLLEYDESHDRFIISENKILSDAKKYAQIIIDNESVWLPDYMPLKEDLENAGSFATSFYCGFADLDNDHIPEFIVSCGSLSVYGHVGFMFYKIDGDKVVPYKFIDSDNDVAGQSSPTYDNVLETCYDRDSINDVLRDGQYFPLYFIEDKKTGNVKIAEAYSGGSAGSYTAYLNEFVFSGINIISKMIISEHNSYKEGTVNYTFRDENGECDSSSFVKKYKDIFDTDNNNIDNMHVLGFVLCKPYSSSKVCSYYPDLTRKEKEDGFVKEYLCGIPSVDIGVFPYDEDYSSLGNDYVLPFGFIIDDLT